jgi:hypothetical protein
MKALTVGYDDATFCAGYGEEHMAVDVDNAGGGMRVASTSGEGVRRVRWMRRENAKTVCWGKTGFAKCL